MKCTLQLTLAVCLIIIAASWFPAQRGAVKSHVGVGMLKTTSVGTVWVLPTRHLVGMYTCPNPDFCCQVVMNQFCNTPSCEYTSNAYIGCGFYKPPGRPARGCCTVYEA